VFATSKKKNERYKSSDAPGRSHPGQIIRGNKMGDGICNLIFDSKKTAVFCNNMDKRNLYPDRIAMFSKLRLHSVTY